MHDGPFGLGNGLGRSFNFCPLHLLYISPALSPVVFRVRADCGPVTQAACCRGCRGHQLRCLPCGGTLHAAVTEED